MGDKFSRFEKLLNMSSILVFYSSTLKMTHFSIIPKVISSVVLKKMLNISSILTFQLSLTLKIAYFSVLPLEISSLGLKNC